MAFRRRTGEYREQKVKRFIYRHAYPKFFRPEFYDYRVAAEPVMFEGDTVRMQFDETPNENFDAIVKSVEEVVLSDLEEADAEKFFGHKNKDVAEMKRVLYAQHHRSPRWHQNRTRILRLRMRAIKVAEGNFSDLLSEGPSTR